jgi:hypothetical protein
VHPGIQTSNTPQTSNSRAGKGRVFSGLGLSEEGMDAVLWRKLKAVKADERQGKPFHYGELSFLCVGRRSGRENFRPRRWHPGEGRMWTTRPRSWRAAAGRLGRLSKGVLGISRERLEARTRLRPTATKAPPELTFRAVANSRNSFPRSSWPRMKTGTANGNRSEARRSCSGTFSRTLRPKPPPGR